MHAAARELLEMLAAKREIVDDIGRDEEVTRWLLAAIQPFAKPNFARAIGALHLMPVNMERAVRLHRLAHTCAALTDDSARPAITRNRLSQIANARELDSLAVLEDPFETPFAEYFGLNGEDFLLLDGPVESEVFVLGLLLDAISASGGIGDDFRARVITEVTSLLRISTLVAVRAGITEETRGLHGTQRVEMPASVEELRNLQAAVTIAKRDLAGLGIDAQAIARFTALPGRADALACSPEQCVFTEPLFDDGEDLIVLQPTVITASLIRSILTEAKERGLAGALTASFHEIVVQSTVRSLREMGITLTGRGGVSRGEASTCSTLHVRIDRDKEITVLVETDTVERWAASGEWTCNPPEERGGPLTLHVLQSLARPFLHFSDYGDAGWVYSLSAADLETIATLEQRNPLAIWYFVHDTAALLKRTTVSGSTLALFGLYRGAAHSYYLSDDFVPTHIPLDPSASGELRLEAQRLRRQHLLPSYAELMDEDIPLLYDSKHLPLDPPRFEVIPRLPTFRPVMDAAVSRVADEVGPEVARMLQLLPGAIPPERRGVILRKSVEYLFERFAAAVRELSPHGLVEDLVLRSEALLREVVVHRGSLSNRLFHFQSAETFAEELREELASRYRITGTLRFLLEYVAATPPQGEAPLSLSRLDEIMALAAQLTDFAGMSDAIHFELAELSLSYLPSGRIGRTNVPYPAYSEYLEAFGLDEITRIETVRQRRSEVKELSSETIFETLAAGVAAEFGVDIATLRRFFQALAEIALRASDSWIFTGRREELLVKLLEHGFDLTTAERLLERFALAPRSRFLVPPPGFRMEDLYPWRADRRYSHRYRPLVKRPRDGGVDVIFGMRHIMNAWRYLVLQLLSNRYEAASAQLRSAMGRLTKDRGDLFNRNVAELLRERRELQVLEQVKKFKVGGNTLRPPGDLDVLAIDAKRKRVIALECKNIEPAHDPHAHAYELKELTEGSHSIVAKQRARREWLRANLKGVLAALALPAKGRWSVDAAIVTSERIPGPFLQRISMPVVSFHELRRIVDAGSPISFG